eukprot:Seg2723.3 transcript_id=Seg2723.3/GoldUCD/mRNA.D3Y31 product="Nuclear pore complex protein Nup88" protein_id=Seg2723.3/GoldUCD/D3Y31
MASKKSEHGDFLAGVLATYLRSNEDEDESKVSSQVLVTTEDNTLIWSEREKQILVIPTKALLMSCEGASGPKPVFQKLSCSYPVAFEVTSMKLSISGQFLVLCGQNGLVVMEMPRQWGKNSLFVGGQPNIICRSVPIGESILRKHLNVKVLQMEWFLGSSSDSHLIILTNDNFLRFYDVVQADKPLTAIRLFSDIDSTANKNLSMNFASALGEMAVSFSIAPEIIDEEKIPVHPIFVMQENGDVWIVWTRINSQNRFIAIQKGPITMMPESDDNYGGEFCSILCLKTSPTIVVLATKNRCIHHCILLDSHDQSLESRDSQLEQTEKTPLKSSKIHWMNLKLYVYETIELDKTLLRSNEEENSTAQEYIQLHQNTAKSDCYFCTSTAGVHLINLSWFIDLKNFSFQGNPLEEPNSVASLVHYLVCTRPTAKSSAVRALGISNVAETRSTSQLFCLLENGELIKRPISCEGDIMDSNKVDENAQDKDLRRFPSPLKRLQAAGSFDEQIKNILRKDHNTPLIKSAVRREELSHEEFYQLLSQATSLLRKENIQKLMKAKNEIKKRCEILGKTKAQQNDELERMIDDHESSQIAQHLAEKISTVAENMQILTSRLDDVVHSVQASSPILSDAERQWSQEVDHIQTKIKELRRYIEVLKQKHENLILGAVRSKWKGEESQLNSTQLVKVKTNMKDQNNRIAELIDRVKAMDKQV